MPAYVDRGIPFISSENFASGDGIDFSIGKTVAEATLAEQRNRFQVREGDFALSRIGTIGKTRFLSTDRKYCLSHALVVIQSYSNDVDRRFLRWLLTSGELVAQAQEGVQSGGVPDLGMGKIRAFRIPLMSLEEQHEIVRRVEALFKLTDAIEKRVEAATKRADKLTQSILAKAFRGELVPTEAELARKERPHVRTRLRSPGPHPLNPRKTRGRENHHRHPQIRPSPHRQAVAFHSLDGGEDIRDADGARGNFGTACK
jgi:type I restriction enzyme, S subunit